MNVSWLVLLIVAGVLLLATMTAPVQVFQVIQVIRNRLPVGLA